MKNAIRADLFILLTLLKTKITLRGNLNKIKKALKSLDYNFSTGTLYKYAYLVESNFEKATLDFDFVLRKLREEL